MKLNFKQLMFNHLFYDYHINAYLITFIKFKQLLNNFPQKLEAYKKECPASNKLNFALFRIFLAVFNIKRHIFVIH